ncbi:MAG: Cytochrome c oxidase assembly factor CtaG [Novosphingobium sp.]|nr:Cytochrome c oxidase assembly factor CtaG [Novosphingobium sp.]
MRAVRLLRPIGLMALAAWPSQANAHGIALPDHSLGWTWDASVTVPLGVSLAVFVIGWQRLRARSVRGVLGRRLVLFALGWLVLAGALVSPLHEAGEHSFSAHMFEHELLMLLAPPLLVLSRPLAVMLWAFPAPARQALGRFSQRHPVKAAWHALTGPVTATLLQAAALLLWHAPMLFDLALASEGWHVAQHVSFFVSALLFWTAMLGSGRSPRLERRGVAALCLFATSIVSGALGALMAFSESPWYRGYAQLGMAPFGLTPAQDQQLAGLIMWIPGGLVHAVAALILVSLMLETHSSRGEVARAS